MERVQATRLPNSVSIFILAFTFGILISSFVSISPLVFIFILVMGAAALLTDRIYISYFSKETLALGLIMLAFSIGGLRYAIKDFHEIQIPSDTGIVISEPEDRDNSRRFVLKAENGEKVLVLVPLYTDVAYGDRMKVSGKLERPGIIEDETGGRPFDYGKYLAKEDIYHTLSFAGVEVVSRGEGGVIKSRLFKIKNNFIGHVQKILAEPYASLLLGLIIAGRDALPTDILEEFRRAGVVHIVVLSGFNITLIALFMKKIFQAGFLVAGWSKWPQAPALASIFGVGLFVIMTGGEATVVRAALMALTVIVAGFFGRKYSAPRALVFAGFLMLWHNPKILIYDPSFQLSFLATLGLIYAMPPLEKLLGFITEKFQIREILAQTISTQIAVLPLLAYSVGDISLVSLPANLLILLVVPWTMFLGFIAVLLSYASVILAWPIAFLAQVLLSWILFVSHVLGSLSFATVSIPDISFGLVIISYLTIIILLNLKSLKDFLGNYRLAVFDRRNL
jgi:competence protein ComEC